MRHIRTHTDEDKPKNIEQPLSSCIINVHTKRVKYRRANTKIVYWLVLKSVISAFVFYAMAFHMYTGLLSIYMLIKFSHIWLVYSLSLRNISTYNPKYFNCSLALTKRYERARTQNHHNWNERDKNTWSKERMKKKIIYRRNVIVIDQH